jgi:hypothetical protein
MRRIILAVVLATAAGSLGSGCYSEISAPPLTYTGVSASGYPTYFDGRLYWQNRNGGWYWWSYDHGVWTYARHRVAYYPYRYYPY